MKPTTELDERFSEPGATATDWDTVRDALVSAELFWIATVRRDGRPHVTPLVAVWFDEALYFCTGPAEQKAVNLRDNQHVVLSTGCNGWEAGLDVIVEGTARRVTDESTLVRLSEAWRSKWDGRWHFEVDRGQLPPRRRRGPRVRVRGDAAKGAQLRQGEVRRVASPLRRLSERPVQTCSVCRVIGMNLYKPMLSIGELARRSGIAVSTLRAWEQRHGFPVPHRLASGHRRYSERDVEALREVLRERRAGSTLESALARSKSKAAAPRSSISATVRHALPDVPARVLSRSAMLAISRAIEDEAVTSADRAIFVGAFQSARSFRAVQRRWRDLSRTADIAIALASFPRVRHAGVIWEVPVSSTEPISREWAVICESPRFSACLVGVERLGRDGSTSPAGFEAVWTVEPDVVREALRTATKIASEVVPELRKPIEARLRQPPVVTQEVIRSMTSLTNRIFGYVDSRIAS